MAQTTTTPGDLVFGQMRISASNALEISTSMNAGRLLGMIEHDDIASTRDALWVLWKLSQDDRMKVNIRELGGLATVLQALAMDSQEVRRYALRTLCNLSFDDGNNAEIRQLGGVKPIVDCLDFDPDFGEDVETTRAALRTLCNLSANDDNKAEIRELGGLGAIVDCLDSSDMRTRCDALRVICNLSIDTTNRQELQPFKTIAKIVDSLAVNDAEMKRYALATIINMTNDEENARTIRDLGGITAVLCCLDLEDLDARRFALRSLCNLAIVDANKETIGQSEQLQSVIACVKDDDTEVCCYALATLMHIFANEDNNSSALDLGVIDTVVACLMSQEDDIKRYATGLLSTLCKNSANCVQVHAAGTVNPVLENLRDRNPKTRRVSARLLRSLLPDKTQLVEHSISAEQLVPVVECLTMADPETCRCASDVLLNLAESHANHVLLLSLSIPSPWSDLLSSDPVRRENARESLHTASEAAEMAAEKRRVEKEQAAKQRWVAPDTTTRGLGAAGTMIPGPRSNKKLLNCTGANAKASGASHVETSKMVHDLECEIEMLRTEVQRYQSLPSKHISATTDTETKRQLTEMEQENMVLRTDIERLSKQLSVASDNMVQNEERGLLEAQATQLQENLQNSEAKNKDAELQLKAAELQLKAAEQQTMDLKTALSIKEHELNLRDMQGNTSASDDIPMTVQINKLTEELEQCKAAAVAREVEFATKLSTYDAIHSNMDEPVEQLTAAYEKVRELQKEMTMMEQFHSREVVALRSELETATAVVENAQALTTDGQSHQSELVVLKQSNDVATAKIAALESVIENMQEQTNGIVSDNSSVGELLASAQSRVQQLMEELASQTHHAEQEALRYEATIGQLQNELSTAIQTSADGKGNTEADNVQLRSKVDALNETYQQQVAKITALEEHVSALSSRNDELRTMLERNGDEVLPVRAMETRILTVEAELEKQNAFIEAQRVAHEAEITSLHKRMLTESQRSGEIERAQLELSSETERQRDVLHRERATAEAAAEKIAALRSELAQQSEFYQKELDAYEREKENLYSQVLNSESKIKELDGVCEGTSRDKELLHQNNLALSQEKFVETSAGAERVKMLEAELLRQESFSREQIALLTEEARLLERELKQCKQATTSGVHKAVSDIKHSIEDTTSTLIQVRAELDEARRERVAALEQVAILKEELANQSDHADRLHAEQSQTITVLESKLRNEKLTRPEVKELEELRERVQHWEQRETTDTSAVVKSREAMQALQDEASSSEAKIHELQMELQSQTKFAEEDKSAIQKEFGALQSRFSELQSRHHALQDDYKGRQGIWQADSVEFQNVQKQSQEECKMALEKVRELQTEMELQQTFAHNQQIDVQQAVAIASEKIETMAIRRTQDAERRIKDEEIRDLHRQFREQTEQLKRELSSSRAENERLRQRLPDYRKKTESQQVDAESGMKQEEEYANNSDVATMNIALQLEEFRNISDDAEIRARQIQKASDLLHFVHHNQRACYEIQSHIDGINVVVSLLHSTDPGVVHIGCQLVAKLCETDDLARAVSQMQVLPRLLHVLQSSPRESQYAVQLNDGKPIVSNDADGRKAALAALAALSAIADNEHILMDLDALRVLLRLFTYADAQNMDVMRSLMSTILNLSYAPPSKDTMRQYGGLKHIIKALEVDDTTVQRTAMRILTHLSVSPENRVEIRMLAGIPPVIRGLSSDNVDIQRNATMLLINLSVNAKNKSTIFQAGGIEPLLVLLMGAPEDDIRQFCIRTLCNLATDEDNCNEIRRLHGIHSLVNCLLCSDAQLVKYASRCIGLLAASELCLEDLIKQDCQTLLADKVSTSSDEVVREGVIALTRMCRSEIIKGQLHKLGVMNALVTEVDARSSEPEDTSVPKDSEDMLAVALKFLAVVSDHPDVREMLGTDRVIRLLVSLIESRHLQRSKPATVCIANLSVLDVVKAQLQKVEFVPRVVKGIQHNDPTVCAEMLRIAYHLASVAENRVSITNLGGVLYIVDSLTSRSPGVQHAAVKALQQMTVDAENEVIIANAGGIRPLVGLLSSQNADTQRRSLCCLGNLTVSTENQELVAAVGGIPRLMSCLQSGDVRVKRDATRTLRNVAFADNNKLAILEGGAIPHLLASLDDTTLDDKETIRYAIRTLEIMTTNLECREVIAACKGIDSILAIISTSDVDTRRSAAGALANLSMEDDHRDEIIKLNGDATQPYANDTFA